MRNAFNQPKYYPERSEISTYFAILTYVHRTYINFFFKIWNKWAVLFFVTILQQKVFKGTDSGKKP
jgi:hypothetical protein